MAPVYCSVISHSSHTCFSSFLNKPILSQPEGFWPSLSLSLSPWSLVAGSFLFKSQLVYYLRALYSPPNLKQNSVILLCLDLNSSTCLWSGPLLEPPRCLFLFLLRLCLCYSTFCDCFCLSHYPFNSLLIWKIQQVPRAAWSFRCLPDMWLCTLCHKTEPYNYHLLMLLTSPHLDDMLSGNWDVPCAFLEPGVTLGNLYTAFWYIYMNK